MYEVLGIFSATCWSWLSPWLIALTISIGKIDRIVDCLDVYPIIFLTPFHFVD